MADSFRPPEQRIVATGWGMVSPLGGDVESTFAACAQGRSGVRELTRFDPAGLPCRIAGQVEDRYIDADAAPAANSAGARPHRLLLTAARQAARHAKLSSISDRTRVSTVMGGHGGSTTPEEIGLTVRYRDASDRTDVAALTRDGGHSTHSFDFRRCDHAPARVARDLDARGAVVPIVSACAASAQAIGEGARLLREGRADAVIAGGVEAHLTYSGFAGFVLLGAIVKRYPSPEKASRPFDRRRNGFVMSEGAAVVILETLAHAQARGATILGELLGYGESADAYRITDVHPEGLGAILAMERALDDARLAPDAVEYVNAHGTSTATNDPAETLAIKKVLGPRAKSVPVSSNKSMLGHTIGAAGAIEAVLSWVGMRDGIVLPTINYEVPDPKCDLDYVPNVARKLEHSVVLSNSFGFGGQNACLCLGRAS